jgi:hypothetical protein
MAGSIYRESALKTWNSFKQNMPILLGMLLLISLFITAVPKSFYSSVFTGNLVLDPLIGAILGSLATGNPLNSYIIGGELLAQGIGLIAITAFVLSWVTVGIVQLPAESLMLGKRFSLSRNLVSFISAVMVAVLVVLTLGVLA